jgi:hypothetical protein
MWSSLKCRVGPTRTSSWRSYPAAFLACAFLVISAGGISPAGPDASGAAGAKADYLKLP